MGEPAEHCTKPQELHYTNAPHSIIAGIIFLKTVLLQTVDKMEKILTSPPFPSPLNPYLHTPPPEKNNTQATKARK